MRNLAERRAERERIKRKRARYWAGLASEAPRYAGMVLKTPHRCSCMMGCGNRRQYEGPTRQEKAT